MNTRDTRNRIYQTHLRSQAWSAIRAQAVIRAGGRCQGCGRRDLRLDGHHIDYKTLGRERVEDITVLCRDCHGAIESVKTARRLMRIVNGIMRLWRIVSRMAL